MFLWFKLLDLFLFVNFSGDEDWLLTLSLASFCVEWKCDDFDKQLFDGFTKN